MQRRGRKLSEINLRRVTAAPRNCCQVMTRIIIITSCTERMGTYAAYSSDMEMQMRHKCEENISRFSRCSLCVLLCQILLVSNKRVLIVTRESNVSNRSNRPIHSAIKSLVRKNPASHSRLRKSRLAFLFMPSKATTGKLS